MVGISVLWFNWRCIKNPYAGGAEVFTHEVITRLVNIGYKITLVTSSARGLPDREELDGYEVWRVGNRFTVYKKARDIYFRYFQGSIDLVIDEINTLPFFTVTYVKEPVIALIHQLARDFWFYEVPPPLSFIGYSLEPLYLRLYRNIPTITVSNSTRLELHSLGFNKVYNVPEGLSLEPINELPEKEEEPTVIFLSRLRRVKRPDHVIRAFRIIKRSLNDSKLWIVGSGPMYNPLKKLVNKYDLNDSVIFFGRVDYNKKIELLRRAHILLFPALREGWGLVVTEANSQGTVAIGYDVPGLRDSIKHLETGILVPNNNIRLLAKAAVILLKNHRLREKLALNAIRWSKEFSWDKTAYEFHMIINKVLNEKPK